MTLDQSVNLMHEAVAISVKLAAPMLLVSMAIGLLISIIQAATQIHEQTITFVPKLLVIALILLAAGPWMLEVLSEHLLFIFEAMLE